MKSAKEITLDRKLLKILDGLPLKAAEMLVRDDEIQEIQEYANLVSIKRLKYNDHGPVHMRMVMMNAIKMMFLLREAGIKTSLEQEGTGHFEESLISVIFASFLHDLGMTIGRTNHEELSVYLAMPIIDRFLKVIYSDNISKRVIVRSLAIEGIIGHMATRKVHSIEAGMILVADGCDMEKGRARIPMAINTESKVGDIHKYSANSIRKVKIESKKD